MMQLSNMILAISHYSVFVHLHVYFAIKEGACNKVTGFICLKEATSHGLARANSENIIYLTVFSPDENTKD